MPTRKIPLPKRKNPLRQELTPEEIREQALSRLKDEYYYRHRTAPAYSFQPGDTVIYGAHEKTTIMEALEENQIYIVKCENEKQGTPSESIHTVFWHQLLPISGNRSTAFAVNSDIRLHYCNCTIDSLLHRYYAFGVNMDPPYQRELVWTDSDREALLDSIFYNADIGRFVFRSTDTYSPAEPAYEIIDGKQRLNTLIAYYENRFTYHGAYYTGLSEKDRRRFTEHTVAYADISDADDKTVLRVFLMLNRGGRPIDPEHLNRIKKEYRELASGKD